MVIGVRRVVVVLFDMILVSREVVRYSLAIIVIGL